MIFCLLMRLFLPSTGRTLGKEISNLGSAASNTATLSSQETTPSRLVVHKVSQSRCSCTSRHVILPSVRCVISHKIVSKTILQYSMSTNEKTARWLANQNGPFANSNRQLRYTITFTDVTCNITTTIIR